MWTWMYRNRFITIVFDRGICGDWTFDILTGLRAFLPGPQSFTKGAGYKGGVTAFVAWRCVDVTNMYRPSRLLRVGITRNANNVPWTRH